MTYTEEDCVDSIQKAAQELGESPSRRQYDDLGYKPHSSWITRIIGSWNKAKQIAGVKQLGYGSNPSSEVGPVPDNLDLSQKEWEELSAGQRFYRKNPEKHKKWVEEREEKIKEWFHNYKKSLCCNACGEEREPCLDFHHQGEKHFNVSSMAQEGYSKESIKEEISKCIVLCSNCHRIKHSKRYEL